MTSTEWIAILIALGALVTTLVAARNSAKKSDVDSLTAAGKLAAQAQKDKHTADEREFERLHKEMERLDAVLTDRRKEIEDLRDTVTTGTNEIAALRIELAAERAANLELRQHMNRMVAALKKAKIEIPNGEPNEPK